MGRETDQRGNRWYTHQVRDPATGELRTERYLSVTTIIDLGIPKQALIGWAARVTAEHAVDKVEKIRTMLSDDDGKRYTGEELQKAKQGAVDWLKGEKNRNSNRAALKGSHVHDAIEAYKLGRPYPGVPKNAQSYYDAFLDLLANQEPLFLQTEANVYNRPRRYSGTLDAIGIFPKLGEVLKPKSDELWFPPPWKDERGPVLVVDYKTGKGPRKGAVFPEVALQLAAYGNATFIEMPDGSEIPMPEVDGAIAIHLQPGWSEVVPVEIGDVINEDGVRVNVFNHFLYAYETARWQEKVSRRVIGKPIATYPLPKDAEPAPVPEPVAATSEGN